jgi:hypothetical protein
MQVKDRKKQLSKRLGRSVNLEGPYEDVSFCFFTFVFHFTKFSTAAQHRWVAIT